ncbi:MAG: DUF58 domain-containing protein [Burkholderiales bacterium]|nr:DUF58 domain-containing protein [Burkholderiales bacterium]
MPRQPDSAAAPSPTPAGAGGAGPAQAGLAGGGAESLLRRLEWTVLRRLDGAIHGNYRTLFRGFGMDLADLREYQFNDDVRHIDWNVTARQDTPYVRQFHEDREVTAWFLLDLSPSIDFGSDQVRKRSLAAELVAVLARILTRSGNRVGAMLYGDKVDEVIPARSGRRHVLHLMHSILARPEVERSGRTDLGEFLRNAARFVPRRSLVFVVSDFISTPGWEKAMARLVERHEVVAVRLYDPLEMDLPDLGLVLMRDSESGESIYVDTSDAAFRKRFTAAAERRENALRRSFTEAQVDVLELATDDTLIDAVMRFADLRKRRSQLAAGGLPHHLAVGA